MAPKQFITSQLLTELGEIIHQDQITRVVVGAVIIREGEVLLLERLTGEDFGGLVELPSGNVDQGEQYLTALEREVKEETALHVREVVGFLGSFDYESRSGEKARQLNFIVEVDFSEVSLSPEEHSNYFWVRPGSELWFYLHISQEVRSIITNAL